MKKIIFTIILLLIPIRVSAADYEITDQLIKADILNNGDVKISELIVMDGTFNGYLKTLSYENNILDESNRIYNASGLELVDIKAKYVDKVDFNTFKDNDFEEFSLVNYASNGDKAKYTMSREYDGYTYKLYYHSNNKKVAFLITYILDNVVVMHKDMAELYWNFITPNDYDDINNVQVLVNLPGIDNSDNFRIWAHGPLAGEITKTSDNTGALATIGFMEASDVLDIRMTFDKSLITDTSKVKNDMEVTLDKILEIEMERAEVANNLRNELKRKRNISIISTILTYLLMIILGIYIYFKYGKSPKSGFYAKYNREFINDYNVEVIDYLMKRKLTPNAMSASIMNLIYKKNISFTEIVDDKGKKNYKFALENEDNINESEKILIEFLFDKVGNNILNSENKKEFSIIDLKKYASGTKTCDSFITSYTKWKNNVLELAKKENFYEVSSVPKLIGVIVIIIAFLVFFYGANNGVDFIPTSFLILAGVIFLLFTIFVYKKTFKGAEHYDKWQAFKNFLNDFGVFELKELPEVVLWERYLVYATIFGLAEKVQKSMNVKIKELAIDNVNDYYPGFVYINMGDTINTSVNNAINSAYQRQAANYANTHSSSSSGGGFGGGFSSGGGFGGGGSSGHGF